MRHLRRIGLSLLVICAVVSWHAHRPVEADGLSDGFTDVPPGHWAKDTLDWAVGLGIAKGYGDGTFRPDEPVTEAEFLVMMLRAYPEVSLPRVEPGAAWYEAAYVLAEQYRWPLDRGTANRPFKRGKVAELIAAAQGQRLSQNEAIQYLLDRNLSRGRTSATVAGYDAEGTLTRAEALSFIRNMRAQHVILKEVPGPSGPVSVRGIEIGQNESKLVETLGQPDRKDASEYGFTWYVYNDDYENYVQAGVQNGKVVALFSNANVWQTSSGVGPGSPVGEVLEAYGEPLEYIEKGNVRYMLNSQDDSQLVYLIDDVYITFFIDKLRDSAAAAVLAVDRKTEEAFHHDNVEWNDDIRQAFEQQAFDLANASRAKFGLKPFVWSDLLAGIARAHSKDMAVNGYFDHVTPAGVDLGDRLENNDVPFRLANENIAAGHPNAIAAHAGWMNSSGHRKAILSDNELMGVGVHFGGEYGIYYTENFIIPLK